MNVYTILWTENDGKERSGGFDIKPHKTLKDSVKYLIKHGANYESQEIMRMVDWMPDDESKGSDTKDPIEPPSKPSNTSKIPSEDLQPKVINPPSSPNKKKKSIFDGILPEKMIPGAAK